MKLSFYTYLHRRNDTNAVFYIGKGKGNRAYVKKRNKFWHSVADSRGFTVEIVARWETEKQAHDHEIFLIWCFRQMNAKLVNQTDGGEGTAGLEPWNKGTTGNNGHWTGKKRPGVGGVKEGNVPWNKGKTGYSTSKKGTKRSRLSIYNQILNTWGMWHARGYLLKCGVDHPQALGDI